MKENDVDPYNILLINLRKMSDLALEAMLKALYEFGEQNTQAANALAEILMDRGRSDMVFALEGAE